MHLRQPVLLNSLRCAAVKNENLFRSHVFTPNSIGKRAGLDNQGSVNRRHLRVVARAKPAGRRGKAEWVATRATLSGEPLADGVGLAPCA